MTMKPLHLILPILIIIASAILCQQIIVNSMANQVNKNDYAELNHVKYGFLSIDEWKGALKTQMPYFWEKMLHGKELQAIEH